MIARAARRGAVLLVSLVGITVLASPAWAITDGEVFGPRLGLLNTLLIFVGAPLGLFGLCVLLVVAGGWRSRPRYRPGLSWSAEPVWFAGPSDPEGALAAAKPGPDVTGGGASAQW